MPKKTASEISRIISDQTGFAIVESYKAIRANINFAVPKQGCKKIMICSSYSGEGKTTTCINLAITIAQTGASVLLIDCDLRRANVHTALKIGNGAGVSNYLSGMADMDDIINASEIPNLRVATSGDIPPNPAELLARPNVGTMLKEMEEGADYILIDTPPVCVVSDVLPMSKMCDGVILVVSHMETKHPNIREALDKLNFAGASIVGMILNKIKIKYNYKSYYNNYY